MLTPIFIIGCGRSGTSILGEFFENNSQCEYFYGADLWSKNFDSILNRSRKIIFKDSHLTANKNLRLVHGWITKNLRTFFHLPYNDDRLTEQDVTPEIEMQIKNIISKLKKERIIIHGPNHSLQIPFIKRLFPTAKFLHIVRDGRDVTCSMMRGMEGNIWAYPKPSGWEKWVNEKTHKKSAWVWNSVIEIIKNDKQKLAEGDFYEIHYEDLLNNPQKTMQNVFKNFGIPFEKPQEDLCKKVQNSMNDSYQAKYSDKWTVNNHKVRIGRYKENLSADALIEVENILKKNNDFFKYH